MRIRHLAVLLGVVLAGANTVSAYAANSDFQAEIQHYKEIFERDNFSAHRTAIGDLPWTGISDEAVFDVLAKKLKEGTSPPPEDGEKSQQMAWYAKGLGISGNVKYKPLLEKLQNIDNSTISRHSRNALALMEEYSRYNPHIVKDLDKAPAGKLDEWRAANMLESGVPELIRAGGKRIYFEHHDNQELTSTAADVLLDGYKDPQSDIMADALAWLCKGLSAGANTRYIDMLGKITKNTKSYQVERYCEKAWVTLQEMAEATPE